MLTKRRAHWRPVALRLGAALLAVPLCAPLAAASSLSQKDVQILAKAIGFLEPPPSGTGTVAVAYDPADPGSKQDADAIAGYFGDGLKAGAATLKPKVTEVAQLSGGGFVAVIAAAGVKIEQVNAATKALHVACITADASAVQAGQCVMSVKSEPKVEILVNRSAAAGSNVGFGSAFLLMAHQI